MHQVAFIYKISARSLGSFSNVTGRGKMWTIYESNVFVEYEVTLQHLCPWLSARWR